MNEPLISIVIPSFNREAFIGETLESIYNQTYSHWECIVVDDGSTDSTVSIIENYSETDSRFQLHHRSRNPKGAPTCRNIGIENATGKYIMFLDSDDLLTKTCLEHRIKYTYKYPDYECWTFPSIRFSDESNQNLDKFYYNTCDNNLLIAMLIRTQWPVNSSFTKLDVLKKEGIIFEESLHRWQDWQFHLDFIFREIRIKRNNSMDFDVRLRQHSKDPYKISSKKRISDSDVNALLELMKYTESYINPNNLLLNKLMLVKWFGTIELIIYLKRGDRVKDFLQEINRKKYKIPGVYRFMFSLPSPLYTTPLLALFFNRVLYYINQHYKKRLLIKAKNDNLC